MISVPTLSSNLIVIPARMASKRFPGKPLALVDGIPMILRTFRAAKQASSKVMVTTCDKEIAGFCAEHDIPWLPSDDDHRNGTERAAALVLRAADMDPEDPVIVWQVDEPFVNPEDVRCLFGVLEEYCIEPGKPDIATLIAPLPEDFDDGNTVKVALSKGVCHWFSRQEISLKHAHVGVYGFKSKTTLLKAASCTATDLSMYESLEQLTWIENGMSIAGLEVIKYPRSINTPEDLKCSK